MTFVVTTPACSDHLGPISEDVLHEIGKIDANQCPLVDFAISLLITTWRYTPEIRPLCVVHRQALIAVNYI